MTKSDALYEISTSTLTRTEIDTLRSAAKRLGVRRDGYRSEDDARAAAERLAADTGRPYSINPYYDAL